MLTAATDSRRLVLKLLIEKGDFPTRRFARAVEAAGIEGRDRAFARHLLAGTIRQRRTLDALFKPFCTRPRVDEVVLWTLRLAMYQRFWMEQVPSYAAFGATLESAKPFLKKALGFANAVMRSVGRAVDEEVSADTLAAVDVLHAGSRAWRFRKPLFPDPTENPVEHAAVTLSFPDELAVRWESAHGMELMVERMRVFNRAPVLCLRVNPLRADRETVRSGFAAAGLECHEGPLPGTLLLDQPSGDLRRLPGFIDGFWSVQDLSSQEVVRLADPQPGERVLDWCAAPGGKSLAAIELAGGKLEVHACDVDHARLSRVEPEAARLGLSLHTCVIGADGAHLPAGPWDLILLDVPCTNTGVLGKRPEARWRFRQENLESALSTQRRIADAACRALDPHTRVLWTTCSLEEEENRGGAEYLAERSGLRIAEERRIEPDEERSGGYAALLLP